MSKVSLLSANELLSLACPYCGRQLPHGTEWVQDARRAWGHCGMKVIDDGELVGVIALAPTQRGDQTMMKMIWVRPDVVGHGLGRQLVGAAAAELVRADQRLLLAVAGRQVVSCATPSESFLLRAGFHRPAEQRLWRLELRQTLLEREGRGLVQRWLRKWRGPGAQPAGGAVSGRSR